MQKIRTFIDANVWYTAANKSTGHSRQLLSGTFPNIKIITSHLVLDETITHLSKDAPNRIYVLESLIKGLKNKLIISPVPGENLVIECLNQTRDNSDAPVLAAAKLAKVDYLVTWNTKDFIQDKIPDIKIVTPAELIDQIPASSF